MSVVCKSVSCATQPERVGCSRLLATVKLGRLELPATSNVRYLTNNYINIITNKAEEVSC